jgi:hypothetical protein
MQGKYRTLGGAEKIERDHKRHGDTEKDGRER